MNLPSMETPHLSPIRHYGCNPSNDIDKLIHEIEKILVNFFNVTKKIALYLTFLWLFSIFIDCDVVIYGLGHRTGHIKTINAYCVYILVKMDDSIMFSTFLFAYHFEYFGSSLFQISLWCSHFLHKSNKIHIKTFCIFAKRKFVECFQSLTHLFDNVMRRYFILIFGISFCSILKQQLNQLFVS